MQNDLLKYMTGMLTKWQYIGCGIYFEQAKVRISK